ncbi:hypothetical protein [Anaerosacchariphilus polymeriproducens]|uniref:hypothetical protein n=1 Tax=Anaerosacchariphilus polymeriproducens TaxID=1812858 RepID=UPI00187B7F50|nr:hypothetical protein [Anaerosacchariphilus polymeriproducens]
MVTRQECSNTVDYSTVIGDVILPFRFTLNLEDSILFPEAGELQKFCYDIVGVGEDTSEFGDLSHFLFGICENITLDTIASVTVVIDGIPQEVILGENVEIKTPANPDNPTGCLGLKFDFGLNKAGGTMQVCYELNQTYEVGPVNVCLFGANTTATGLAICGPVCSLGPGCDSVFYQIETVCVPVKITPFADPGEATATCCGEPTIVNGGTSCPGASGSCFFTVTQRLCIRIPISFGAVIETGDAKVQCGEVTEVECDCSEPAIPADGIGTVRKRKCGCNTESLDNITSSRSIFTKPKKS